MKRTFFSLLLLALSCVIFAENGKKDNFNHSFNSCISTLNECVAEIPMSVAITLSKDPETLYNMCTVNMDGKVVSFRVMSGIVRDQVYPELNLLEMDVIPTSKQWTLKFIGDRAKLCQMGGIRYEFRNAQFGEMLGEAVASNEADLSQE